MKAQTIQEVRDEISQDIKPNANNEITAEQHASVDNHILDLIEKCCPGIPTGNVSGGVNTTTSVCIGSLIKQTGTSVLSQANAASSLVLNLFT